MEKLITSITAIALLVIAASCSDDAILKPEATVNETTDGQVREDASARAKAVTIVGRTQTIVTGAPVLFLLASEETAQITVDWGDGTTDEQTVEPGVYSWFEHMYADDNEYAISITGDLHKIVTYENHSYDVLQATDANFDGFRNLQTVGLTFGRYTELDLSKNRKLTAVDIYANHLLVNISLPQNHRISRVDVSGASSLSPTALNTLIGNVYKNAVKSKITDGFFRLDVAAVADTGEMLGPPSEKALNQLRDLRDNYGWLIMPDPDGAVIE